MGGCIEHLGRLCKTGAYENLCDDWCGCIQVSSEAFAEALAKSRDGASLPRYGVQGQCPPRLGIEALHGYSHEAFGDLNTGSRKGEPPDAAADGFAGKRMDIFWDWEKLGGGQKCITLLLSIGRGGG
jgi:hypothetical protein